MVISGIMLFDPLGFCLVCLCLNIMGDAWKPSLAWENDLIDAFVNVAAAAAAAVSIFRNEIVNVIPLPTWSLVQARLVEHRVDLPYSDDNEYMVPAAESSVDEMLIKVRVEDEAEEKDCVICLEQLKVGSDASSMPCKHIFHGDCIQEWLSTSHYCPICRFEMPTH
ncbi:E3 ubiquitin-protein ligase SIS3-like [Hibiscus syriacus]|uniref:E3 ubiquitin-protein ligase SIS3-like n=1 Tax=Hibiscus syriacus TaxID=106335 RepID=UPI0019225D64|nr:E3 ubiquitin-protein ligase SIS3-like [Hibiscus syriacus]